MEARKHIFRLHARGSFGDRKRCSCSFDKTVGNARCDLEAKLEAGSESTDAMDQETTTERDRVPWLIRTCSGCLFAYFEAPKMCCFVALLPLTRTSCTLLAFTPSNAGLEPWSEYPELGSVYKAAQIKVLVWGVAKKLKEAVAATQDKG